MNTLTLALNNNFNKREYKSNFESNNINNINRCCICDGIISNLFDTYRHNDKTHIKTCYLCHMILNYDKKFTGNLYLIELVDTDKIYEIDQIIINNKVNEIIQSQHKILHIKDYGFDIEYKLVKTPLYKMLLDNHDMRKYLVFFTNLVLHDLDKINQNSFFDDEEDNKDKNETKYNKYDVSFWSK